MMMRGASVKDVSASSRQCLCKVSLLGGEERTECVLPVKSAWPEGIEPSAEGAVKMIFDR